MKTKIWLLTVALCFATIASAGTMAGTCTLTSGVDPSVNPTPPGTTFNPVMTNVVYTCLPFTVPAGFTLTQVDISIGNDYGLGTASTINTVDFSYTVGGFSTTALTTSVSGVGITSTLGGVVAQAPPGNCSPTGTNSVDCMDSGLSITTSFGAVTVTGSSTWIAGGVGQAGSDQFNVGENFTYSAPAPEPASLLMIGIGLVGLSRFQKHRRVR